jgi:hypothetical protein
MQFQAAGKTERCIPSHLVKYSMVMGSSFGGFKATAVLGSNFPWVPEPPAAAAGSDILQRSWSFGLSFLLSTETDWLMLPRVDRPE